MRKSLILAGAAALMLAATRAVDATEPAFPQLREAQKMQVKRRKNKTANKINVFIALVTHLIARVKGRKSAMQANVRRMGGGNG